MEEISINGVHLGGSLGVSDGRDGDDVLGVQVTECYNQSVVVCDNWEPRRYQGSSIHGDYPPKDVPNTFTSNGGTG